MVGFLRLAGWLFLPRHAPSPPSPPEATQPSQKAGRVTPGYSTAPAWPPNPGEKAASACRRMSSSHPELEEEWQSSLPFSIPRACRRNKF